MAYDDKFFELYAEYLDEPLVKQNHNLVLEMFHKPSERSVSVLSSEVTIIGSSLASTIDVELNRKRTPSPGSRLRYLQRPSRYFYYVLPHRYPPSRATGPSSQGRDHPNLELLRMRPSRTLRNDLVPVREIPRFPTTLLSLVYPD